MIKKMYLIALCYFFSIHLFAQSENLKTVTTIGVFDSLETKSGFRINDFYVELNSRQRDSLKGKKVSVTGELVIVKGIDPSSKEIVQGSLNDRYFIADPKFTIIYDAREPLIQDSDMNH